MRIVAMGTGGFAVPTFFSLRDSAHEVVAVISRPPRAARGRKLPPPSPMARAAEQSGLPLHMPDSINSEEAHEVLKTLAADLFFVCDYGQILSADTLGLARLGGINLHASLLPLYRGAAPINWAIYDGRSETGVTLIHMTPRLDAGPTLSQAATPITPNEDAVLLEERLAQLGVTYVHDAIQLLDDWDGDSAIGMIQDPSQATKAPRLKKEDGRIDWTRSARQIHCQVRAMKPWPGTFALLNLGKPEPIRVAIESVAVVPAADDRGIPGSIAATSDLGIFVATGDGVLEVQRLQPAGKRMLDAQEFLRGYPLAVGNHFVTS